MTVKIEQWGLEKPILVKDGHTFTKGSQGEELRIKGRENGGEIKVVSEHFAGTVVLELGNQLEILIGSEKPYHLTAI